MKKCKDNTHYVKNHKCSCGSSYTMESGTLSFVITLDGNKYTNYEIA